MSKWMLFCLGLALACGARAEAATFSVTNTQPAGVGSLAAAINAANTAPNSTIEFHIPADAPGFAAGVFTIDASALPAVRANVTIDGTTQTTESGDTNASGPEIAITGAFPVNAGTAVLRGTTLNWNNGKVSTALTAAGGTVINWASGGILAGTLNVASGGTLNMLDGILTGTLNVADGGTLNLLGKSSFRPLIRGGTLNNAGNVVQKMALLFDSTIRKAVVNNSGTWTSENRAGLHPHSFTETPSGLFNNTGTFTCGAVQSYIPFNNSGTVSVVTDGSSNTATFSGSGSHSGTLRVDSRMYLRVNDATFATGTTVTGAGSVVTASSLLLTGTVTVNGRLQLESSTTSLATAKFAGSGVVDWTYGDLSGELSLAPGTAPDAPTFNWLLGTLTGTLRVPAGASLVIPTVYGPREIAGGTLDNYGTIEMQPGAIGTPQEDSTSSIYFSTRNEKPGSINNFGVFNMAPNTFFRIESDDLTQGVFNNTGSLNRLAGAGIAIFEVRFNNKGNVSIPSGGGVLSYVFFGETPANGFVQTSGSITMGDGTWSGGNIQIQGGVFRGAGKIFGHVTNSSILEVGNPIGALQIEGKYTQTATGTLKMQVGGTTPGLFDQLQIIDHFSYGGNITLDGNLTISLINGFVPAPNDTFRFLDYPKREGAFASATYGFGVRYNSDHALLSLDSIAPTVTLSSPANGSAVQGLVTISGTATDNEVGTGLLRVDAFLKRNSDGNFWTGTEWGTTSPVTLPTTLNNDGIWTLKVAAPSGSNLTDGSYFVFAYAYDKRRQRSTAATSTFIVDRTLPTVTLTTPANGTTIFDLTSLGGAASDNSDGAGINHVVVILRRNSDGKFWTGSAWDKLTPMATILAGSSWVRKNGLPSGADLPVGTYFAYAYSYDRAGNRSNSATSTFTVASATARAASSDASSVSLSSAAASAVNDTITLSFAGTPDANAAADVARYSVTLNGAQVAVASATSEQGDVVLSLGNGVLKTGDKVVVVYSLLDKSGREIKGEAKASAS